MFSKKNSSFLIIILLAVIIFLPANTSAQSNEPDLTRLPLGDGKLSDSPRAGWIFPCRINPNGGGAFRDGNWINDDGTYDLTRKAIVDGAVQWQNTFFNTNIDGTKRQIATHNLPTHPTGIYPIQRNDDAFQYDRNPNTITEKNVQVELPANPVLASQPGCVPGAIGILLTGVALFNALDAPGRDAVAHETQDACQGHPERSGNYHYHNVTTCLEDNGGQHSPLMGYIVDGFGIYGKYGEHGELLTSADLDECHGHTHEIEWDGNLVTMYHYHATWDFPYTVGCIRGTYDMQTVMQIMGGRPGNRP